MDQPPQTAPAPSPRVALSIPIAIVIAGVLIAGAIVYANLSEGGPDQGTGTPASLDIREVSADDHVYGSRDAEVLLVEYSDFECPYCARIHLDLKRIVDESEGAVAWAYRHLPLTSIHEEALPAAIVSECIARLGGNDAFWAFADHVFRNQGRIGDALYSEAAAQSGIAAADLNACIVAGEFEERIAADTDEAVTAGANGTPYVVVLAGKDKTAFAGALPYATIKQVIETVRQ